MMAKNRLKRTHFVTPPRPWIEIGNRGLESSVLLKLKVTRASLDKEGVSPKLEAYNTRTGEEEMFITIN